MIRFSCDYKAPWLGFTTQARGYDKWAHFAGSAAGVCLCVAFQRYVLGLTDLWTYMIGLWLSAIFVFAVGLGIEITQGYQKWIVTTTETGWIPASYYDSDGFSFIDLAADVLGILLAVGVVV